MDLPWNPAKLEQRIARAWRKHQKRTVQVIHLVCEESIEHRMIALLDQKTALAKNVLHEGNISKMALPSGRAAFMERLEELLETSIEVDERKQTNTQKPNNLEEFKENILLTTQEDLLSMQEHTTQDGKDIILAVVKNNQESTKKQIQEQLEINQLNNHQLEMMDEKTYAAIQRLAELGMININQEAQNLFESKIFHESRQRQQLSRIKKARKTLDNILRKFDMAKLLISGNFHQEAATPLKDVLKTYLITYAYVVGELPNLNAHAYPKSVPDTFDFA